MKKLVRALQIFNRYTDSEFPTSCEHNQMFVHVDPKQVNQSDITELENIGFEVDYDLECFVSNKYGSY
jgi:hypothetical protein